MEKDKITQQELQAADLNDVQPPTLSLCSDTGNAEFDAQKAAQDWAKSLPDR